MTTHGRPRLRGRAFRKAIWLPLIAASSLYTLLPRTPTAEPQTAAGSVEIRGKALHVDGRPFIVKGVHYGPWRPGSGPNKGYPYPGPEAIATDLDLIRELQANTIVVFDPPDYVLHLAHEHELKVLYAFYINWWAIGSPEDSSARESILRRVREHRDEPALLGWILGNEIPIYALERRGEASIVHGLAQLYDSIKALDPQHPVTHSNWPPTKDLDLDFLDLASFNVYPLWPPEVVAMGYGSYLKQVLQPVAGSRPLLITELGASSLEAGEEGQARLLRDSWTGLVGSGASGGVVFEFADEWWKNYDNPVRPGSWWTREAAPADEKKHDEDPEEYYGLVTSDRRPKPAFYAVQEIFAAETRTSSRRIPAVVIALLFAVAVSAWLGARRLRRRDLGGQ